MIILFHDDKNTNILYTSMSNMGFNISNLIAQFVEISNVDTL